MLKSSTRRASWKRRRSSAQAAAVIASEPVTITLRYLQTLTEIASEKNSTIIFPLPIELMNLLDRAASKA